MRILALAFSLGLAGLIGAGAGYAQDTVQTADTVQTVDTVDHVVTGSPRGQSAGRRKDLGFVRPGALLLASFDRNFDGLISRAEVAQGAVGAFHFADKNSDKVLSGFEQSDWASTVGGVDELLSNPMLFDADLDREVTEAEFGTGMVRLMDTMLASGEQDLRFADLVRPFEEVEGRGLEARDQSGGNRMPSPGRFAMRLPIFGR